MQDSRPFLIKTKKIKNVDISGFFAVFLSDYCINFVITMVKNVKK